MNAGKRSLSEQQAWIALASTPGVGDVTFARLLEVYGSARGALSGIASLPGGDTDTRLAKGLGISRSSSCDTSGRWPS